jgi:hypothetical protein
VKIVRGHEHNLWENAEFLMLKQEVHNVTIVLPRLKAIRRFNMDFSLQRENKKEKRGKNLDLRVVCTNW